MFSKIPSALKVALPLTLAASPLLMSAAQPPVPDADLDTYGLYCDAASSQSNAASSSASRQSNQRDSAQPISTQTHVLVTSDREMSAFVRNRVGTALRLLRSNPYHNSSVESALSSARDNCVAIAPESTSKIETKTETLVALSTTQFAAPLFSSSPSADLTTNLIAQSALPDLGNPSAPAPAIPSPTPTTPSPAPATQAEQTQPAPVAPATAPVQPTAQPSARPLPAVPPASAASQAPAGFSSENREPSVDPFNFTPTTLNPTPFDGSTIQTLAALSDGNYRYVSGKAEDRPYSDAELQSRGGFIFIFKKEGNAITGNFSPRSGLPPICVTGIASGDVITGTAYPSNASSEATSSDITSSSNTEAANVSSASETYASIGNGALQVSGATRTADKGLYYARAVLDLSDFSMINAGSALPPESCIKK